MYDGAHQSLDLPDGEKTIGKSQEIEDGHFLHLEKKNVSNGAPSKKVFLGGNISYIVCFSEFDHEFTLNCNQTHD